MFPCGANRQGRQDAPHPRRVWHKSPLLRPRFYMPPTQQSKISGKVILSRNFHRLRRNTKNQQQNRPPLLAIGVPRRPLFNKTPHRRMYREEGTKRGGEEDNESLVTHNNDETPSTMHQKRGGNVRPVG